MGVMGALLLTLSAATPASSVFVIVPEVITQAGTGALWSLLIAAVVAAAMSLVYAELGSATPWTGGEYAIVGQRLGPLPGFMVLGSNLASLILAVAVLSLGVPAYLGLIAPNLPAIPVALAIVAGATVLCVLNIRTNARVTGAFLAVELLALLAVAAIGLAHPARPLSALLLTPVAAGSHGALGPAPLSAIALAVTAAVFAFDGYGSAVYFGEETRNAPRDVARAIRWALGLTVLSELIPVTALLLGAPDLKALFGATNMVPEFVTARAGAVVSGALGLAIALAIVNAVIALVLMSARQLYSTGRDGVWWGALNRRLVAVHPRLGSPVGATLAAGALAALACLVDKTFLITATGAGLVVIYISLCISVLFGRAPNDIDPRAYRMAWRPWPAILAVVVLIGVLANTLLDSTGRQSLGFNAAVLGAAGVYYGLVLRRRGAWTLRGPVS